jgi:membrane-bound lytic murein transglycosylase A
MIMDEIQSGPTAVWNPLYRWAVRKAPRGRPNLAGGIVTLVLLTAMPGAGGGCTQQPFEPSPSGPTMVDYMRQLPPGAEALRLVTDPARLPDLAAAYRDHDALLLEAIDRSRTWFTKPSSQRYFPMLGFTHEQAAASLEAMDRLLAESPGPEAFQSRCLELFDVYESVGYNGEGTVLFTGYFSPIFRASLSPSAQFSAPLYRRPDDLVTDPMTGHPQGRQTAGGSIVPYYTRDEIEESGMFAGRELVWLENDLDVYIVHVNGSAKLRLDDGTVMYVGYAGKTDLPYASLGRAMLEAGVIGPEQMNLTGIRRAYDHDPETVRELMHRNENYVFFREYPAGRWPAGSLGVQVTAETSLATDKAIYPRGGLVMVDTRTISFSGGPRRFERLLLDQDTGGALKAPGRADIFMGIGPGAEILAGDQYAEGRLFYLFLKPQFVDSYRPIGD